MRRNAARAKRAVWPLQRRDKALAERPVSGTRAADAVALSETFGANGDVAHVSDHIGELMLHAAEVHKTRGSEDDHRAE